jgi:hypothetical protein
MIGMSAVCALSFFSACQSKEKKAAQDKASFNGSMRDLQHSLEDLLPMVVDSSQYNDPANRRKIKDQVHELVQLSTKVQHNPSVAERDPSVTFLSQAFAEDLKKAEESLNMGKREYARYSLMNVTSYCIECHTRTSTGPSFQTQEFKQTLASLSPLERGEFLLATRQFDGALKELNTFIDLRLKEQKNFYELDKAVRDCLAITVRYLRDPKKSMAIAEKIKNAPTAPYYLRQSAVAWEKALHEWMKEKKHKRTTPAALISQAEKLNQKGMQNQIGMMDRGGDIYFLRALSDLHLAMSTPLKGDELGKALYLTGVAYEGVPDQTGSNMHENYYESCIDRAPHSEWSKKCFRRLEESVYAGYTGSSGVSLPTDVRAHLDELQKKAL